MGFRCQLCDMVMEYDEGDGNIADGYSHYDCVKEETERRLEEENGKNKI